MMNSAPSTNLDSAELAKFAELAHGFWDREGAFKTLHDIDPVRVAYVAQRVTLTGSKLADVGCGGGLFAESLTRLGARVTAIDLAGEMIEVARLHASLSGLDIDYRVASVEQLAAAQPARFDTVCCMELIEHVPDPAKLIASLARLVRPGGSVFISTISRGLQAFATAIVGAEYLLALVPKGTHEYGKLVRPAELARYARAAGLTLLDVSGMSYNPLTRACRVGGVAPNVNYLAQFLAPAGQA